MNIVRFFITVIFVLTSALPAIAEPAARDLMAASELATKSATEIVNYRLELIDANNRLVQARKMLFRYKRGPEVESTLIQFLSPPAISGTGLVIEDTGASANDIWLYLPATRRLRRISGAEKTNWFMGTEFSHEDFEDYQMQLYRFEKRGEERCGDSMCDVISAEPSDEGERSSSGYARKIYWIERNSKYPVRIDYVGRAGNVVKMFEAQQLTNASGYWRPQVVEMRNLGNGRKTRLVVEDRQLDVPLQDYLVSARYLRAD